jgi:hypothetical protein
MTSSPPGNEPPLETASGIANATANDTAPRMPVSVRTSCSGREILLSAAIALLLSLVPPRR